MKLPILGEISFFNRKQVPSYQLMGPDRGWYPVVNEPYTGAWQKNDSLPFDSALSHFAVYRCITLIAADVAKMRVKLVEKDENGIWIEQDNPAYSPVLRKPNDFQNRIQFYQHWITSKLTAGNTYIYKRRDDSNKVRQLYILDPYRTKPLVAPDGSVFYQLCRDNLAGQFDENLIVPSSEIIHDRMNPLFPPFLVGLSPIYASYLPAISGLRIQSFSDRFFRNHARPSGILTAPGDIPQATADRIKAQWDNNYSGDNLGKIAVAGSGLTWVPLVINAVDSQLIEQLKINAEQVCSAFGVPNWKAGIGSAPNVGSNVQATNQIYYQDCIQIHVESIETLLDEGLGLGQDLGTEFDLDNLLRMDTQTQTTVLGEQVLKGITAPNEARKVLGYGPKKGGDSPMMQQQQFSLEALAERDQNKPFAKPATPTPATPTASVDPAQAARALLWDISQRLVEANVK